jgi:hypothetical protein
MQSRLCLIITNQLKNRMGEGVQQPYEAGGIPNKLCNDNITLSHIPSMIRKVRNKKSSAKEDSKAQINDRRMNYEECSSNYFKINVYTDLCLHAVHITHISR